MVLIFTMPDSAAWGGKKKKRRQQTFTLNVTFLKKVVCVGGGGGQVNMVSEMCKTDLISPVRGGKRDVKEGRGNNMETA